MPMPEGGQRFTGFALPNYTQVPDALFDELLPDLSGAELKVLLYIIRRTLGFKKPADDISLKQICEGIITRDGRMLDHGTGLAVSTASKAVKSLEEWGVIEAIRNQSAERGSEPTTYRLQLVAEGVYENRRRGGPKIEEARLRKSKTQETVYQETVGQETDNIESIEMGGEDISIIRQVFIDLCQEFGDEAPEASIGQRAVNLWRRSGLSRAVFVTLAYAARKRTREYQGKRGSGKQIISKPAYFFEIVENAIAERQPFRQKG